MAGGQDAAQGLRGVDRAGGSVHLVYLVRPGDDNEELRHSLRSVATNLPPCDITIAGNVPTWVRGVHAIPTVQDSHKHANAYRNLRAVLDNPDVPDEFVLMNDDFFITAPIEGIPVLHRGPVSDVLAWYTTRYPIWSDYMKAMQATRDWLRVQGVDAASYELHVPMTLHRDGLTEVLDRAQADGLDVTQMHYRTAYGSLYGIGGTRMDDVKVYDRATAALTVPFASTRDDSYRKGAIGRTLARAFPTPCRYEVGHGRLTA